MANRLPEGDQDSVVLEPVTRWQHFAQRNLGFVGSFGFHQAPSIGNAMDVSIDADSRLRVGLGHDQVGGFAADTLERHEQIDLVGHESVKLLDQVAADSTNHTRLGAIETDWIDQTLESPGR